MSHRFDPDLDHRRSIRLSGHDYTRGAAVFVIICTYRRDSFLRQILDGEVALSEAGAIVAQCWQESPEHLLGVETDAFVVMPNHVHGIVILKDDASVGATHASPRAPEARREPRARHASPLRTNRPLGPAPRSIGAVVGSFKSAGARQINDLRGTPGAPVWQRSYYEHVVRDDDDLNRIRNYLLANPMNWAEDNLYVPNRIP